MRGGTLVSQAYELRTLAENFAAGIGTAASLFQLGAGILSGGFTLPAPGSIGGGGTTIINNYYVTGNTVLSKDTATQDAVSSIVTASQTRALGYTV
jgi:hypothetical protein